MADIYKGGQNKGNREDFTPRGCLHPSHPLPSNLFPSHHSCSLVLVMVRLSECNGGGNGSVFCNPEGEVWCSGPDVGVGCKTPEAGNGREPLEPVTVLNTGVSVGRGGNGCVPIADCSSAGRGVTGLYTGITFLLLMCRATSRRLISVNSLQEGGTTSGAPVVARSRAMLNSPNERKRRCV